MNTLHKIVFCGAYGLYLAGLIEYLTNAKNCLRIFRKNSDFGQEKKFNILAKWPLMSHIRTRSILKISQFALDLSRKVLGAVFIFRYLRAGISVPKLRFEFFRYLRYRKKVSCILLQKQIVWQFFRYRKKVRFFLQINAEKKCETNLSVPKLPNKNAKVPKRKLAIFYCCKLNREIFFLSVGKNSKVFQDFDLDSSNFFRSDS